MPIYLSLGSNLGDREANLRSAIEALHAESGFDVVRESRAYETEPVGDVEQPPFLNMALRIETTLQPLELLNRTQDIERRLGRTPTRRWGPRVIDIDIVLWDDRIMATDRLTIPHPEFRNRAFVLVPLAEIAPQAIDPETQRSIESLAQSAQSTSGIRIFNTSIPKPKP